MRRVKKLRCVFVLCRALDVSGCPAKYLRAPACGGFSTLLKETHQHRQSSTSRLKHKVNKLRRLGFSTPACTAACPAAVGSSQTIHADELRIVGMHSWPVFMRRFARQSKLPCFMSDSLHLHRCLAVQHAHQSFVRRTARPFSARKKFFHLNSLREEAHTLTTKAEFDDFFNEVLLGYRAGLRFDNSAASIVAQACSRFASASQAQSFLAMSLSSQVTNLQELAECTAACAESTADVHHILVATHAAGDMTVGPLPESLPQTARLALLSHNATASRAISESASRAFPPGSYKARQLHQRMGQELLDVLLRCVPRGGGTGASSSPQQADELWAAAPLQAMASLCSSGVPAQAAVAPPLPRQQGLPAEQGSGTEDFLQDLLAGVKPSAHTRRRHQVQTEPAQAESAVCTAGGGCCLPGGVATEPSAHHAYQLSAVCSVCTLQKVGLASSPSPLPSPADMADAAARSVTIHSLMRQGEAVKPPTSCYPVSLQVAALASLASSEVGAGATPPECLRQAVATAQAAAKQHIPLSNEACAVLLSQLVRHRGASLALRLLETQAMLRASYLSQASDPAAFLPAANQRDIEAMRGAYSAAEAGTGLPPMPQGRQRGVLASWELGGVLCPQGVPTPAAVAQLAEVLRRCDVQQQSYMPALHPDAVQAFLSPLRSAECTGSPMCAAARTAASSLQEAAVHLCCLPAPANASCADFNARLQEASAIFEGALHAAVDIARHSSSPLSEALLGITDVCCALVLQQLASTKSVYRQEWHAAAGIARALLSAEVGLLPLSSVLIPSTFQALERDVAHPDAAHASIAAMLQAAMPSIQRTVSGWSPTRAVPHSDTLTMSSQTPPQATSVSPLNMHGLTSSVSVVGVPELQRSVALLTSAVKALGSMSAGATEHKASVEHLGAALQDLLQAHARHAFPSHLSKPLELLVGRFVTAVPPSANGQLNAQCDALLGGCEAAGLQLPPAALAAHVQRLALSGGAEDSLQAAAAFAACLPQLASGGPAVVHGCAAGVISSLVQAAHASEKDPAGPFDDFDVPVPQAVVHDAWLAVSLPFHRFTLPQGRRAWWSSRAQKLHPEVHARANQAASAADTQRDEWRAVSQVSPFEHRQPGAEQTSLPEGLGWPPSVGSEQLVGPRELLMCAIDVLTAAASSANVEASSDASAMGADDAGDVTSRERWVVSQLQLLGTLRHVDGIMHIMTTCHVLGVTMSPRVTEEIAAAIVRRPPNSAVRSDQLPLNIVQGLGVKWSQTSSAESPLQSRDGPFSRGQMWARCVLAVVDTLDAAQPQWSDSTYRHFLAFSAHRRYSGLTSRLLHRQRAQDSRAAVALPSPIGTPLTSHPSASKAV